MTKIAFLGLGNMGRGMAGCLLRGGYEVHVYNRTPGRADDLVYAGAIMAASPREAAAGAQAVFAMVADDAASREVWLGENGALRNDLPEGALAIDCSTLSHAWVMVLAAEVAGRGLSYIDCPVTGLPPVAAAGKLVLLIGAEATDLGRARPLLDLLSSEVFHFGPVGTGTAYKLMINLMGAVQIAAAAEGLVIAEQAGLDLDQVRRALEIGQAASPQVVRNVTRMVSNAHETDIVFSGRLRLKDTSYGVQMARALGVDARFGEIAVKSFAELVDMGAGDLNESKVLDVLRDRLKA